MKRQMDIASFFSRKKTFPPENMDSDSMEQSANSVPELNPQHIPSTSNAFSSAVQSGPPSSSECSMVLSQNASEGVHQPKLTTFPATKARRFSVGYYVTYPWIEYNEVDDSAFCFACRHFTTKSSVRKGETMGVRTFIEKGFRKWKNASELFKQHEKGERHQAAMLAWGEYRERGRSQKSVASLIDSNRGKMIEENRRHIKILLRATRYLGRQGLAFRGNDESKDSSNKGNFFELVHELTEDTPELRERLLRRYGNYTSPECQNDFISVFSRKLLKNIAVEVKNAPFFSVLADETKDASKKEQLSVVVRYVVVSGGEVQIKEKAIGVHHLMDCGANSIFQNILSTFNENGLSLENLVAQCYDGANVMKGCNSGVQKRMKEVAPQAMYLHCHAHRLNLVLVEVISSVAEAEDFFLVVRNIYSFISNSGPRHERFIQEQERLQSPVLSLERTVPTRWFYWFSAVEKIRKTYSAILAVLAGEKSDRVESSGYYAQMSKEQFIFLLFALEKVLKLIYVISQQLQSPNLDLASATQMIRSARTELKEMRSQQCYEALKKNTHDLANSFGISRKDQRRTEPPKKLSQSLVLSSLGQKEKPDLKRVFFSIIDRILVELDRRFTENEGILQASVCFQPKSSHFLNEELLQHFIKNYENFLNLSLLDTQLALAKTYVLKHPDNPITPADSLKTLIKLPEAFLEIIKLFKIYLTLPVTTAENERFFSDLKRVKNYLRTTSGDERLQGLMMMAVDEEEVKKIDLNECVDDFAKMRPRRYPLN